MKICSATFAGCVFAGRPYVANVEKFFGTHTLSAKGRRETQQTKKTHVNFYIMTTIPEVYWIPVVLLATGEGEAKTWTESGPWCWHKHGSVLVHPWPRSFVLCRTASAAFVHICPRKNRGSRLQGDFCSGGRPRRWKSRGGATGATAPISNIREHRQVGIYLNKLCLITLKVASVNCLNCVLFAWKIITAIWTNILLRIPNITAIPHEQK